MAVQTVTLPNGNIVHLGRKIPLRQRKVGGYLFVQTEEGAIHTIPALSDYYDPAKATAPLPTNVDWSAKAMSSIKRKYMNDQLGCCVISSAYHQEGLWSGNDSDSVVLGTDNEVVTMYHRICGPGDNGCNIAEVLDYTKKNGLPFNGVTKKIDAYVSVDNTNKQLVMAAIAILGTLKLGIDLPNAWANAPDGGLWDMTNSGIVGGHDVPCVGYNDQGVEISTWGGKRRITWPAFTSSRWISECYCPLAPDWFGADNLAPNGINAATLKANLDAIANGQIPPFGPPPETPIDWLI